MHLSENEDDFVNKHVESMIEKGQLTAVKMGRPDILSQMNSKSPSDKDISGSSVTRIKERQSD